MEAIAVTALTFSIPALGIAVFSFIRLDNIEKKLKDFDAIPEDFSSEG